jgi:hypothetical protein
VPAGPNDLVTLAQAYAWLSVASGTDDANMQLAVSAYSQLITDFCSRPFVLTTFNEVYDGRDMPRLVLRNYPVTTISSLSIFGIPQVAATSVYGPGYIFNNRTLDLLGGDVFTRGMENVAITYQAGFATIPFNIQMACLDWLKSSYMARTRDLALASHRAGDTEEKFEPGGAVTKLGSSTVPMPATVFATLSQYLDFVPA